ncbi:MAG: hypothetical protein ACOYPS_00490 [Phycisphaerales bacterium]
MKIFAIRLMLPVSTCLLLGACTTGNERATLGNGSAGNAASLPEFVGRGEAPPPASTGSSIEGLSRANWAPMYVVVPTDGLAQKPTYARTHLWVNETARSRGQMPTIATSLELETSRPWAQAGETAASPFLAVKDGVRMIVWDMWWNDCPGIERVRPPMNYVRTPPETLRVVPPVEEDLSQAAGAQQ